MSSFKIFDVSGSGLSAESVRLNTVASNLANADSVSSDPNSAYKSRHPVFQAVQQSLMNAAGVDGASNAGVRVTGVVESKAPPAVRYDPGNPMADAQGNVYGSNVNVIEEMTDMISASRAYQDNVEVMNTSKDLMLSTLKLGQ
jgi:flagellar basal-body rod protein FlgC